MGGTRGGPRRPDGDAEAQRRDTPGPGPATEQRENGSVLLMVSTRLPARSPPRAAVVSPARHPLTRVRGRTEEPIGSGNKCKDRLQ